MKGSPEPDIYVQYNIEQHNPNEEWILDRINRTNLLLASYIKDDAEFDLLVRYVEGKFVVVDGFHRLSIIAAVKRESVVNCYVTL